MKKLKVALVSSYPPQRSSSANYSSALLRTLHNSPESSVELIPVAIVRDESPDDDIPVEYVIRRHKHKDYRRVADALNAMQVDLVCIQHEFEVYGGPHHAGEYLCMMVTRLEAPIVTTFHRVLSQPSTEQYRMIRTLTQHSHKVVVLCESAKRLLQLVYGVSSNQIERIPYGVPDVPWEDADVAKHALGLAGRTILLSSGLLGKDKGIETALQAMPYIVQAIPNVLYIILGVTHQQAVAADGELYRCRLESLVQQLQLERHVVLQNEFLSDEKLSQTFRAADFYLAPYLRSDQAVSGTLAYALGTGRAVISTPFAYAKGRRMIWSRVGQSYEILFERVVSEHIQGRYGLDLSSHESEISLAS